MQQVNVAGKVQEQELPFERMADSRIRDLVLAKVGRYQPKS